MWTLGDFVAHVLRCANRYEFEHSWFHWPDRSQHILAAWRMYRCASNGELGLLLLGDTKIRKSPALVMNFGLASAHGVQETEEQQLVERLMSQRADLSGPGPAVPVMGPGAILSDRMWTPLLNDAFLLGGIHRNWDFHLVEEGFDQYSIVGEQEFLRRRAGFGPAAQQYAAALARGPEYYRNKWLDFLTTHQDLLWRGSIPRVFARELLGLERFGYVPQFSSAELGFYCRDSGAAQQADFEGYLNHLAATGLLQNDRPRVLGEISSFLFEDANALAAVTTAR